jgi:L-fuculokinase
LPPTPVIAIFDIGKTNKKLFLFDEEYNIVLETSQQLEETMDEDGFPCENLSSLTSWVTESIEQIISLTHLQLKAINFSTYGASFVHIDKEGKPVAPLCNYLKPFPKELKDGFYKKYGGETRFAIDTASPILGNLNSGLQLYRIKQEQPELFTRIHYSLHLPQYMSFLVTGRPYSDLTSIGCHTGLWNFGQNYYHEWLFREGISAKLAPIFPSDQLMPANWNGQPLLAGVGLHDSSAALIPYLSNFTDPFILISTGTWCITLNPFNHSILTAEELESDCLCYMEYHGKPVKASRLFAGYEHEQQVKKMAEYFNVPVDQYTTVAVNTATITRLSENGPGNPGHGNIKIDGSWLSKYTLQDFDSYEEAYHHFMLYLIQQQVESSNLVLKNCAVKKIYVDGGFSRNKLYMHLLATSFPGIEVYAASVAQASAIGAALAVHHYWNKETVPANLIELRPFTAPAVVP